MFAPYEHNEIDFSRGIHHISTTSNLEKDLKYFSSLINQAITDRSKIIVTCLNG